MRKTATKDKRKKWAVAGRSLRKILDDIAPFKKRTTSYGEIDGSRWREAESRNSSGKY
jgi:hypothetical protein